MILTIEPLETWPGELTQSRENSRFSTDWDKTKHLLGEEVDKLAYPPHGAKHAYARLQLATESKWIRQDGFGLKQGAEFYHPGVVLLFDDPEGREMTFKCDHFVAPAWRRREAWKDNAHAIYKTLEALRGVARWGAVDPGQQFVGFHQMLGSGIAVGQAEDHMTIQEAAMYLAEASDGFMPASDIGTSLEAAEQVYRVCAHLHHPDKQTGNAVVFAKVGKAIEAIRKAAGR